MDSSVISLLPPKKHSKNLLLWFRNTSSLHPHPSSRGTPSLQEYKPGPDHANADVFSRLPLPECATEVPTPVENILAISMLESLPVTAKEITSSSLEFAVCLLLAGETIPTQNSNPTSNDTLNLASTMAVSCGEVAWLSHLQEGREFSRNCMKDTRASRK